MSPLFLRRHYKWLAQWAGEHLKPEQWGMLAYSLTAINPNFNSKRFIFACAKARGDMNRRNAA